MPSSPIKASHKNLNLSHLYYYITAPRPPLVFYMIMEIESVKCECCGLGEDCTHDYINGVKADFDGMWLCGLCAEAVRDEVGRGRKKGVKEAVKAHMSFFRSNPAFRVADGMRQMLRRRSGSVDSAGSSKRFSKPASKSQVDDDSSFSLS